MEHFTFSKANVSVFGLEEKMLSSNKLVSQTALDFSVLVLKHKEDVATTDLSSNPYVIDRLNELERAQSWTHIKQCQQKIDSLTKKVEAKALADQILEKRIAELEQHMKREEKYENKVEVAIK